jgi:hypothetical protein
MGNIMYKIANTLFISLFFIAIFWMGCDKIDDPYTVTSRYVDEVEIVDSIPIPGPAEKKVLLEDYTGIQCVNCPKAAKLAHDLEDEAKGGIIVLSVHAGYNARPDKPPFDVDLTTPVGEEYNTHYDITANPYGIINRKKTNSGVYYQSTNKWKAETDAELKEKPTLKMEITATLAEKTIETKIKWEAVADLQEAHKLVVLLAEDGIVTSQKNNDPSLGEDIINDYKHHNVLRESLNGTWGVSINPLKAGDIRSWKFKHEIQTQQFNGTQYKLIAFIYNAETEYIEHVEICEL